MKKRSIFILFTLSLTNNLALQADDWTGPALFAAISGAAWTAARHNQHKEKKAFAQKIIEDKEAAEINQTKNNARKLLRDKSDHLKNDHEIIAKLQSSQAVKDNSLASNKTPAQPILLLRHCSEEEYIQQHNERQRTNALVQRAIRSSVSDNFHQESSFLPTQKNASRSQQQQEHFTAANNPPLPTPPNIDAAQQSGSMTKITRLFRSLDPEPFCAPGLTHEAQSIRADDPKEGKEYRTARSSSRHQPQENYSAADTIFKEPADDIQVQQPENHRRRAMVTILDNQEQFIAAQAYPQAPEPSEQPVITEPMLLLRDCSEEEYQNQKMNESLIKRAISGRNLFDSWNRNVSLHDIQIPADILAHCRNVHEIEKFTQCADNSALSIFLKDRTETRTSKMTVNASQLKKLTKQNGVVIACKHSIIPKGSNEITQRKIIITVHGTAAINSSSFGDSDQNPISQECIINAQKDAILNNCLTDFLVIKWNGQYSQEARQASGQCLAADLKELYPDLTKDKRIPTSIEFIAHSYGCDVARYATMALPQGSVTSLVTLASPKTDINLKQLGVDEIHVYGDHDAIATAETWKLTSFKSTNLHNPYASINIRFKEDQDTCDHTNIKRAIKYLPEIRRKLAEYRGKTTSLYFQVKTEEEEVKTGQDIDHSAQPEEEDDDSIQIIDSAVDRRKYHVNAQIDSSNGEENRPTYEEALKSEALSKGIPQSYATSISTVVGYIESFFQSRGSSQPSQSVEDIIHDITQKKINMIRAEPNLERQTTLLAQAQSEIIQNALQFLYQKEDDISDEKQEALYRQIQSELKPISDDLTKWQYMSEWIIGRTRTQPNGSWSKDQMIKLQQAREIFNECSSNEPKISQILLKASGLDDDIKQALYTAVKQDLHYQPTYASDNSLQEAGGGDVDDDYVVVSALGASDNSGQDTSQARGLVQTFKALMFGIK